MSLINSLIPSLNRGSSSLSPAQRDGAPSVRPVYSLKETPEAFGLEIFLPGVAKEGLTIDAEDQFITFKAERSWKRPTEWSAVYRESSDLPYELVLEHDNVVNVDKIHAELRDGVLKVSLPKTESIKPRKIEVA